MIRLRAAGLDYGVAGDTEAFRCRKKIRQSRTAGRDDAVLCAERRRALERACVLEHDSDQKNSFRGRTCEIAAGLGAFAGSAAARTGGQRVLR